jgi:predicted nucleotidyltransferase
VTTIDSVTTIEDVTLRVIDALNASRVNYMLVGSFSTNAYGIPRSTKDADFVLQLEGDLAPEFYEELGDDFEIDPQLRFETNTGTFKQEIHFSGTPFTVELFRLSKDGFDQERFRRKVPVKLLGRETFIPTAEDVVIMKARWLRDKDRADIKNVLTVQRGKLDWPYIEKWCREHGTLAKLGEIQRTVPEI